MFCPLMEDCADSSARYSPTQEEICMLMATESMPGKWTDEKHCLFLKSMESLFVSQLHKSIDTFGWQSQKHNSTSCARSSGQFKVFHSDVLSKISFQRKGHGDNQEQESKVPSARKHKTKKSPASHAVAPSVITTNKKPLHDFLPVRQDSVGSHTEVMDQNFIEEDQSLPGRSTKRMRTYTDVASSTDQVVPSYIPPKD